jgi:hypothetical protein
MSSTTIRAWQRRWPFGCLRAAAIVWAACAAAGCGASDGLDRQAISGTVTWEGQPLESGAILLEPATSESGTPVGSTIRRGKFAVARNQGPVPGLYIVRIYASSGIQASPTKGQSEGTPRPMVEWLPAAYNAQTELRVTVVARSANHFRFDLRARE